MLTTQDPRLLKKRTSKKGISAPVTARQSSNKWVPYLPIFWCIKILGLHWSKLYFCVSYKSNKFGGLGSNLPTQDNIQHCVCIIHNSKHQPWAGQWQFIKTLVQFHRPPSGTHKSNFIENNLVFIRSSPQTPSLFQIQK